jgi:hypothetical protein
MHERNPFLGYLGTDQVHRLSITLALEKNRELLSYWTLRFCRGCLFLEAIRYGNLSPLSPRTSVNYKLKPNWRLFCLWANERQGALRSHFHQLRSSGASRYWQHLMCISVLSDPNSIGTICGIHFCSCGDKLGNDERLSMIRHIAQRVCFETDHVQSHNLRMSVKASILDVIYIQVMTLEWHKWNIYPMIHQYTNPEPPCTTLGIG